MGNKQEELQQALASRASKAYEATEAMEDKKLL